MSNASHVAMRLTNQSEMSLNDYLDSATTTLMPLFNPDDVPTLRPWLVKNLEPMYVHT